MLLFGANKSKIRDLQCCTNISIVRLHAVIFHKFIPDQCGYLCTYSFEWGQIHASPPTMEWKIGSPRTVNKVHLSRVGCGMKKKPMSLLGVGSSESVKYCRWQDGGPIAAQSGGWTTHWKPIVYQSLEKFLRGISNEGIWYMFHELFTDFFFETMFFMFI